MAKKNYWDDNIENLLGENSGYFGHNCDMDLPRHFKKLDKLGATELKLTNYYTIKMKMPKKLQMQNAILFYLLKEMAPTDVRFSVEKQILTLEYHW